MATIEPYETKAGRRWRVRYRKPDRRQTDKRGFKTKREAQAFANAIEVEIHSGGYIEPTAGKITVNELGEPWLARQGHMKENTLRDVKSAWRNHVQPVWGPVPIASIRRSEVVAWAHGINRARTTTSRAVGVLSGILDDAVADRRIASNPAKNIPLPAKGIRDRRYLTHAEVRMLAEASLGRDALIYSAAYLGLRWGELTGLRVKDVDLTRRRVQVAHTISRNGRQVVHSTPKNHERRTVPVPAFLTPMLADLTNGRDGDECVFTNQDGGILSRPRKSKGWWRHALLASGVGLDFRPHDLRHTAASLAVQVGAHVKAVQRMLGHKSAAMTLDVYADLFDSDLDAVSDALDAARAEALR